MLLARMRAEWVEMPGMRLTTAQATRLWAINPGKPCGVTCPQCLAATTSAKTRRGTSQGGRRTSDRHARVG